MFRFGRVKSDRLKLELIASVRCFGRVEKVISLGESGTIELVDIGELSLESGAKGPECTGLL